MRKSKLVGAALAASALLYGHSLQAAAAGGPEALHWPLPAGDAKYGAIDGKHIWQTVAEQAGIAERYRDNGHPQFWGRIAGTSGDAEDVQWLQNKYRQIGLTDTRVQTVNYFNPQWSAQSWSVAVSGGDKTVPITSAQPSYASPATDGKELDLEIDRKSVV